LSCSVFTLRSSQIPWFLILYFLLFLPTSLNSQWSVSSQL
jgi:hypothetical protein